jgi:anti-sigma factor RsiW
VTCDEAREHLADHLLGTLDPALDERVAAHLRGCAACRAESAALADGVGTFAAAAHDVEPPPELRDRLLAVLDDEWTSAPAPAASRRRRERRWLAAAAVLVVGTVAWAAYATVRASSLEESAARYEQLLGVLGGEDVRVGELVPARSEELRGSVVIYDSKVGQSWVLVLVRAPGREGTANVTMVGGERSIDLHPIEFDQGGEGATWLVTAWDLTGFDRVNLWNERGRIATAAVRPS